MSTTMIFPTYPTVFAAERAGYRHPDTRLGDIDVSCDGHWHGVEGGHCVGSAWRTADGRESVAVRITAAKTAFGATGAIVILIPPTEVNP